jgi:chromosome segregation ATPase
MRTRDKIIIFLVGATLVLGALIFFSFEDNEVEANYFRWLVANKFRYGWSSPGQFMAEELPSGTLFYGGLAIFAIVMTIVVLKMIRDGEIQALRQRLRDLRTEKNEAENLLQEHVWKGKTERQAKDSVTRDLESSIEKIELLLSDLNEKERELKARDAELMTLKSSAMTDSTAPFLSATERQWRDELKKKTEIIAGKDAALRDSEQRLNAKTRQWDAQIREKDALLKERENELNGFRSEMTDLNGRLHQLESAKKRAEDRLEEELRQKKEILGTEAQARKGEEKRLGERIKNLEAQVSERDKSLRQRDSEISGIGRQLKELGAAKAQAEIELEKTAAKAQIDHQEKDHALRQLEQRLSVRVHELQEEIGERDLLVQMRDDELKSLRAEVKAVSHRLSDMAAAKVRVEEALQEDLKKEKQQHEAEKVAYREFEDRHNKEIKLLTAQLTEREAVLKRRDDEVQGLEKQAHSALQRLEEASAAKEQIDKSLRDELRKEQTRYGASEAAARKAIQQHGKEIESLKSRLDQEQKSRKSLDEENKALKAQVASLAQQLAKVGSAKEHAAQLLQQTLKKEKAVLQASDSAVREIEEGFKAKIEALEEQLAAKENLVGSRSTEVASLQAEISSLQQKMGDLSAAKERAETLFEDAVAERNKLVQSKDVGIKKVEEDLSGKISQLESHLREKEALLHRRESELAGFKDQLAELATSKEQAAEALHEDLRRKAELLGAKDATLSVLEERFNVAVRDLESELNQKQELLEARDTELKTLSSKVHSQAGRLAELEQSKDDAARVLEDELRRTTELLQSKETALKTLDDRLTAKLRSLEGQLGQKQELLDTRAVELDALMSKMSELTQKLSDLDVERERSDRLLQEELREKTASLKSNESSLAELDERFSGRIESLERQVIEKHRLLEASGMELADLRAEMSSLAERLDEAEAAKVNLETLLQQERSKAADQGLVAMVAVGADGEQKVNGHGMDTLLSEREELLQARDKLIQNLMTELKEKKTQLAKQEIEVWKGIERREAWKHRLSKVGIRLKD